MIQVVILGAGNVASHLYLALNRQKDITIVQCYNRKKRPLHPDQSPNMVISDLQHLIDADIYILAISDDAIKEVSTNMSLTGKLVVHTSGSAAMDTIADSHRKGVLYPLQTFSKDKSVDFSAIPFCLEAQHDHDLLILQKIASLLSNKVYTISSQQRSLLHVAALFVNNFTNYMFSAGNDICEKHNIPFEILHPLILETAKKTTEMNPDLAQTGPAVRNDVNTINRHMDLLSNHTYKEIYQTLTKAIQSKYGKEL